MKTLIRWLKFSFVGILGTALQLSSLAILNQSCPGHYLLTSSVALELTLLHNFVWHLLYTWRDRRDAAPWQSQCVRFHCSNGIVSLLGNLCLMRALVRDAHLPVLVANFLSVLSCSIVNFHIGHRWAFRAARPNGLAKPKIAGPSRPDTINLTNIRSTTPAHRPHYAIVQTEVQT